MTMGINQEMQRCIELCNECHNVCLNTFAVHCLEHGGEHVESNHSRLMLDCAEICQTSANFMLRGSMLHSQTCVVCAEVCEACADDCEQFDEAQMQACAEICRRCAESCNEVADQAVPT